MVKALRNESTRIKRLQFTPDLSICCLLNGMWQVSGAHGRIDPKSAQSMFSTWMQASRLGIWQTIMAQQRLY